MAQPDPLYPVEQFGDLLAGALQAEGISCASWSWRRLAHHRMQYTGDWDASPRGNTDPSGSFVLFQSNWDGTLANSDGSPRKDIFLLVVPPLDGSPSGSPTPTPAPAPTPTPDTIAPAVSVMSPSNGALVSGTVNLTVSATDNVGVTMTKYYVDGNAVAAFSPAVMTYSWNSGSVLDGTHILAVTAYDAAGNSSQANVALAVKNDWTRPSVVISSPVNGSKLLKITQIGVTASDNVALRTVAVYVDTLLVLSASPSTSTYAGSVPFKTAGFFRGMHSIRATATDASGNTASTTINVYK